MLSRQAFSVYCDHFLRDAVNKNDQLRKANKEMEVVRSMLVRMQIYKDDHDELLEINLQTPANGQQQKDAARLVYDIYDAGVEFPFDDIPRLRFYLSGVHVEGGFGRINTHESTPKLTVHDDDTVELQFSISNDVTMTGTLENFAGTVQDVQTMIDSDRVVDQLLLRMGVVSLATTEQPVLDQIDSCLDGATVSLKKVQIAKKLIHPIILMNEDDVKNGCLDESGESEDDDDDELQVLTKVNKKHEGLFKAADDRKMLQARNMLLKESRELFQTIAARHDANTIQFRLEQGSLKRMVLRQEPAWSITPSDEEVSTTIPLSALSKVQLHLANIPWSCLASRPALFGPPGLSPDNRFMVLNYAFHIEAVFCFDDSLDDVDMDSFPGGLRQYIYMVLINHPQGQQGPQFTMRLMELRVQLSAIQSHLDALGIETNASDVE